jgi:hypothetical protein
MLVMLKITQNMATMMFTRGFKGWFNVMDRTTMAMEMVISAAMRVHGGYP